MQTLPRTCTLQLKSSSKVNFGLWIKEKRPDGYHEIETIFFENTILSDEIKIEFYENKKLSIDITFLQEELNNLIPKETNLVHRAALLLFEKLSICGHCKITIDKKIPIQGGLGGGSSNAACVLKGLNQIFDYQLHESELLLLSKNIGSDVSFFILGKTCLGKGRGEKLNILENKLNLNIKIVKPTDIFVPTKLAYELFDSRNKTVDHRDKINALTKAMKQGDYDLFFSNVFNDFEEVVFTQYPKLLNEKQKFLDEGFQAVGLCGSGSALYGVSKKS